MKRSGQPQKTDTKKKRNKTGAFGWNNQSTHSSDKDNTRIIKAPKIVDLYSKENANELLKRFDNSIFSSKKKVILDFRNTA